MKKAFSLMIAVCLLPSVFSAGWLRQQYPGTCC